ncbi:MobQ family relaxase [uncultured Psychrobacter sp.]|uniref:MobQ family relaxase n=1 Tax=uncultured Psychrobacter sp. TaxID=259303 RepID=UPI0026083C81|nr:MobQ family relaxase [uncultured Psychrobacter sp.]
MAIYHLSVKTFSRSNGQSAIAAVAYRAGAKIHCEHERRDHDYSKKRDVIHSEIFLPPNAPSWATDRQQLWNEVERAEKRKNSTVAREFEVALPNELNEQQRIALVQDFAKQIVARHGCAVDAHLHDDKGSYKSKENQHAHIMLSTRRLEPEGFTKKTRELDEKKSGEVVYWREQWAKTANEYLREYGIEIDHRSLKDQGLEREPTIKMGVAASALERKGIKTDRGDINREVAKYNKVLETNSNEKINSILSKQIKQATELHNKLRFIKRRLPEVKRDIAEKQPKLYQAFDDLRIPTAEPEPIRSVDNEQEQERIEPVSARLDRQISTERHTNERGRELPPVGSSESNELGQGHNSEVRLTDQTSTSIAPRDIAESPQQPKEPVQQPKAPQTTQEAVKTPTAPNRADEIAKKRRMVKDFVQRCKEVAEQTHRSQLDALKAQAKPMYAEIERLKDNEPWNPFKTKAWQAELDKKVAQYNEIKSSFDDLKIQGVTKELIQAVHAEEHRRNPTKYQNISAMEDEVAAYDQEQIEVLREHRQLLLAMQRQEITVNVTDKGVAR